MNDREADYQWAGPYLYSRQVIAVSTESAVQTFADLADKKIGVQATTRAAELFLHKIDSSLPEVKQVNCFATTEDLFASIRKGYVEAVEDGTDAVERMETVEASRYDLILMDIQMPKMDGYTAAREIRTLRDNQKANIPIVAVTANAFEEDKKKAFESGMNGHISKPINREAIMRMLDQIFGQEITTDEGETEGENR